MSKMVPITINEQWELILPEYRQELWKNLWEKPRLDSMFKNIKKGDVVFDVGAERGDMPALYESWGARVVPMEASRGFWPEIRAIWDTNKMGKPLGYYCGLVGNTTVRVYPYEEDATELNGWPRCAYGNINETEGFSHLAESAAVMTTIKIDDYCELANIYPDVITMDIEGGEFEALKGAEQTLLKKHPLLYISVHPEFLFHNFGEYERHLHNWLIALGYDQGIHLDYDHEHHYLFKWRKSE